MAYALTIASEVESVNDPNSYKEAMASSDSSKWLVAMKQEMESLAKNKTWVIIEAPKNMKVLGRKWAFKKKEGLTSTSASVYKARVRVHSS